MTWHWAKLGIGIWVLLSPWLLGFSGISVMMWSNLVMGMVLVLLSVWQIFGGEEDGSNSQPGRMEVAVRPKKRNLPA